MYNYKISQSSNKFVSMIFISSTFIKTTSVSYPSSITEKTTLKHKGGQANEFNNIYCKTGNKAVIIFAKFFKKVFTGTNFNFFHV